MTSCDDESLIRLLEQLYSSSIAARQAALQQLNTLAGGSQLSRLARLCTQQPDHVRYLFWDLLETFAPHLNKMAWIDLINDGDQVLRRRAERLLWQQTSSGQVALLVKVLLAVSHRDVIEAVLEKIPQHPQKYKFLRWLDHLLTDQDEQLVRAAIAAMKKIGHWRSVVALTDLWRRPENRLRLEAAIAIGEIGKRRRHGKGLSLYLQDEDDTVRAAAAWAYGKIYGKAALPQWRRMLNHEIHPQVIAQILKQLSKVNSDKSVPLLLQVYRCSTDSSIKTAVEATMDNLLASDRDRTLFRIVRQQRANLDACIFFCGKYRLASTVPAITKLLTDSKCRSQALTALGWIGDRQSLPVLQRMLAEGDASGKTQVAAALRQLWRPEDFDAILAILRQPDPAYDGAQQIALQYLTTIALSDDYFRILTPVVKNLAWQADGDLRCLAIRLLFKMPQTLVETLEILGDQVGNIGPECLEVVVATLQQQPECLGECRDCSARVLDLILRRRPIAEHTYQDATFRRALGMLWRQSRHQSISIEDIWRQQQRWLVPYLKNPPSEEEFGSLVLALAAKLLEAGMIDISQVALCEYLYIEYSEAVWQQALALIGDWGRFAELQRLLSMLAGETDPQRQKELQNCIEKIMATGLTE